MLQKMMVLGVVVSAMAFSAYGQSPEQAGEAVLEPFVVPLLDVPDAAVDLRKVFVGPKGEALPAVRVKDGQFVAGGERVRFWGVNLCFAANFPEHEVADKLAAKLAAFGINCVRLHHMDNQSFPRGIWKEDFSGFDEQALDRLDYLLAAFKKEGIYVNVNLHVSRDFTKTGSDYDKDSMPPYGKQVCIFDPTLIELQKQYARDLLGHVNKYTGLRYANDTVVGLVEISNENSIFLSLSKRANYQLQEPFEGQLVGLWNEFLRERYENDEALQKAWADDADWELPEGESLEKGNVNRLWRKDVRPGRRSEDYVEFLTQVDMTFFRGMYDFLKQEIGVKCPITGTEGFTLPSDYVQSHLDYVDAHGYWQHPEFPGRDWDRSNWRIPNTAMVDEPSNNSRLMEMTFQRMMNPDGSGKPMPFTVSEYNTCAPNDYQAEGIPMMASFAAAQDWDGIFMFAYSHSDKWDQDFVNSYFDIHSNPVKMVQMAAGALIFRRGDVEPIQGLHVMTYIPPERMYELGAAHLPWTDTIMNGADLGATVEKRFSGRYAIAPYEGIEEKMKIHPWVNSNRENSGTVLINSSLRWEADGTGTGQFITYSHRGLNFTGFNIKQRSSAIIGDAYLTYSINKPNFSSITLSPLDGDILQKSKCILITACGRVENTGQVWNEDRTSVGNNWGHGPTLVEKVEAHIRLSHSGRKAKLKALGGDGKSLQEWVLEKKGGEFDIRLGQGKATIWYLLEVE